MPRNAPRTQPVAAPQDQGYGEAGEQKAAQRAMPLPERSVGAPTTAGDAAPGAAPAAAPVAVPAGNPVEAMLAAAQNLPPTPGLLRAPSARPNEPVTAGLSTGMGPGPEAIQPPDRVTETLDRLALLTGNAAVGELAARARTLGR